MRNDNELGISILITLLMVNVTMADASARFY